MGDDLSHMLTGIGPGPGVEPGMHETIPAAGDPAETLSRAELARYSRHIVMPEVGLGGQLRLKRARVAVIGLGGLGSPISLYLAAAGVGTIGLVDDDVVEHSNLQRQVLYGVEDVGRSKTAVAAARLRHANEHVRLEEHPLRLNAGNALSVLEPYDVVVDGTDSIAARYLLNDACVLLRKPFVYGSIHRFEGQVAVLAGPAGPCYRCLFREPPPPGLVPSCAESGVLGVLPAVIGSLQALETIKLVLGTGEPLTGRLLLFDGLAQHWRELILRRNPDCPACGDLPTITGLTDYDEFCDARADAAGPSRHGAGIPEIDAAELERRLLSGRPPTLVDVRETLERAIVDLDRHGAHHIPLAELERRMDELDRNDEIVLVCRTGVRSARALRQLRAAGYSRLWNLKGGIHAWIGEVDPYPPQY
jgi:sulfur-carrier protein adenylyltransferase/sulfurtransferase